MESAATGGAAHPPGACDPPQNCGGYMSLVGHWEEAKFPAGINLVQTMAPDCVRGGSGLDYNTCGIRIGGIKKDYCGAFVMKSNWILCRKFCKMKESCIRKY